MFAGVCQPTGGHNLAEPDAKSRVTLGMQKYFYSSDQNVVLEPAQEVLPRLWVGKHSGEPLELISRNHPSVRLVDEHELFVPGAKRINRPHGQRYVPEPVMRVSVQ